MTLHKMIETGKVIEVGYHYMTDDNVVIIRCYGGGTSTYWVRDDDLFSVYRTAAGAVERTWCERKALTGMQKRTRENIAESIADYLKH